MMLRARFYRWCHLMWNFRPWRWGAGSPHRAVDVCNTPPHSSWPRTVIVACDCGIEFGHA